MPRISAFEGIVILMYYADHPPAHFHVRFAEFEAKVDIASGEIIGGELPRAVKKRVRDWTELFRSELIELWGLAENQEPLGTIEPL